MTPSYVAQKSGQDFKVQGRVHSDEYSTVAPRSSLLKLNPPSHELCRSRGQLSEVFRIFTWTVMAMQHLVVYHPDASAAPSIKWFNLHLPHWVTRQLDQDWSSPWLSLQSVQYEPFLQHPRQVLVSSNYCIPTFPSCWQLQQFVAIVSLVLTIFLIQWKLQARSTL